MGKPFKNHFMLRTLFSILTITIASGFATLYGQRAMYVDDFDEILGDQAKEEQLLSYAQCNNITKLLLYDLYTIHQTQDLTQTTTNGTLARFIERAKLIYGITEMGATGENANFFTNVIDAYNTSRSFPFEKFDVFNLEFEFWNSSLYSLGGVYCTDYLTPGSYGCNAMGAFQFYTNELNLLSTLASSSLHPVTLETYVWSYITQAEADIIVPLVDRVLVAGYVTNPANAFVCSPPSAAHDALRFLGSNFSNIGIDVSIIYSSEPTFMQSWLNANSLVDAENTFTNAYNACTGTWKANVGLGDFTYFAYHDMWYNKVDASGWVMCYLPEITLACVGDDFTLNCGVAGATYQWQTDNGSGSFSDIAGETGSSLTVTNIGSPQEGYLYRVVTTLNGCTRYSNPSKLHLNFQHYLKTIATMALPVEPMANGDFFGNAVDMTSNRAVITSCEDMEDETGSAAIGTPGTGPGSAFIYKTDPNGNWIPDQKVVASDRALGSMFGISAGVSPVTDVVIVGDHRKDVGGNADAGGTYIYELLGATWVEVSILNATGADLQTNALFGHSVSVYDNIAVVGAPGENGQEGAVYVFNKTGGSWSPIYTRIAPPLPNGGDEFGFSVDVYRNYLIIGAPGVDANTVSNSGEAYIYENVSGTWTLRNTINDNGGQVDEHLGNSVSIGNRTAAIGSSKEDAGSTTDAGSVDIYNFTGTSWASATNLTPALRETNARFGQSVSVSDQYIAVGAYTSLDENNANSLYLAGGGYVFTNDGNYTELQKLVAPDRAFADGMGRSIATNGDFVMVGAAEDDHSSFSNAGSVHFFQACASIPLGPGAGLEPFASDVKETGTLETPVIYPNPNNGTFMLKLGESWNGQAAKIEVYDIAGNLIQGKTTNSASLKEILIADLQSGCYLINVSGRDHFSQHKVIVH